MTTKAEPTAALQGHIILSNSFSSTLLEKNKLSLSSRSLSTQSTASPSESSYSLFNESITLGERSISFSPLSSLAETLGLDDYSDEEIERCWYGREEYRTMAEDSMNMYKLMAMGKRQTREDCYRGLEKWTEDGRLLLDRDICHAIEVVLDEQERQWDEKCEDEELIAILYQAATQTSNMLAISLGIADERGVQKDLDQARSEVLAYERPKPEEPVKERGAPLKKKGADPLGRKERAAPVKWKGAADPPGRKIEKSPSIHDDEVLRKPERRVKQPGTKKTKGYFNDNSPHLTAKKKVSTREPAKKATETP
jgi:hypothetical protein